MAINNPHDKYFKTILNEKEQAKSFIENYLPDHLVKAIDMESLKLLKDSFISKDLKEFYSDILYQVSLKGKKSYIYVLIDHKTKADKSVIFQLLKYMIAIWEKEIKDNPNWKKLPAIFPMVFYHGKQNWKVKESFSDYINIDHKELKRYILDYKYILCDMSAYSDDEIKGEVLLRLSLLTFKHIFDNDLDWEKTLIKFTDVLSELSQTDRSLDYLKTFLLYLLNSAEISTESLKKTVEKSFSDEGGKLFMTAAEKLKSLGREEGREKGIEEGKTDKAREIAKNMLIKQVDRELISEVTGLSLAEIEKLL